MARRRSRMPCRLRLTAVGWMRRLPRETAPQRVEEYVDDGCGVKRQHLAEQQASHHRSEEHTSELQSLRHLVCRLLLEKKKKNNSQAHHSHSFMSNWPPTAILCTH